MNAGIQAGISGAFWSAGECMLELRPGTDGQLSHAAAGDTFNTAVYLKRLLPQLTVRYVSALGEDVMSGLIRAHMRGHGIDDSMVATIARGVAGLYSIETDAHGERRFSYWRTQSAARSMLADEHHAQLQTSLAGCGALLLTGISLAILDDKRRDRLLALAVRVRAAGGWVILDNNYRGALWDADTARRWLHRATRISTHALFSFDDEVVLYGDANPQQTLARVQAAGVQEAIIKLGPDGCLVAQGSSMPEHVPAHLVRAIDTTAAGDSFNAGYLARRMAGASCVVAAQYGCALAAAVVTHQGAIIPAPAMPGESGVAGRR